MPERWHVPPIRQTNWRQQCSTCGKQMSPRTWTYCSKSCEISRRSSGDPELPEDVLEQLLDKQIAIESANRRQAKALRVSMSKQVERAYADALANRTRPPAHPMVEGLSPSSPEFWQSVLGEQFRRYRSSKANFVRDLYKFACVSMEGYTFYGVVASEVVDTTLSTQNLADIQESGAVRKLCKLLPRSEASILTLLALSDDAISQAVSEGSIGPMSTLAEVQAYVEANRD